MILCKQTDKELQILNLAASPRPVHSFNSSGIVEALGQKQRGCVDLNSLCVNHTNGITFLSGYFVQDAGDIILTGHARASWEFLLHHALVSLVFLRNYDSLIHILVPACEPSTFILSECLFLSLFTGFQF